MTEAQHKQAREELLVLAKTAEHWSIGDAEGLDALAVAIARTHKQYVRAHLKNRYLPPKAQGAERSTRMIREMKQTEAVLHAWPNKPAPPNLQPAKTWPKHCEGSGTWGTIALAIGLGLRVELHPLEDIGQLPPWLTGATETQQLSLF